PATPSMTILLADDNVDAAWALSKLLQREGHRSLVAAGGREALQLAQTPGLDGAILDIGMPDLDGVEVARLVRSSPWGHRLWLIALTGWGGLENRRVLLQHGFDEHLIKPVDMAALNEVIRSLGRRHEPA
ncbi:MAG: response regulator, partial [Burkholderiaceae bacterium]